MRLLKVLLIEDSAVIRETLTGALEEMAPVRVVATAADEAGGLALLREQPVDVAIIDVFLQTGSGLAVLVEARKHGCKSALIVFSNFTNAVMRSKCLAAGADRVFDKSDDIDRLVSYCVEMASSG